jgi:peptidoglycan/LPS O-acetylase OafA/YrhL
MSRRFLRVLPLLLACAAAACAAPTAPAPAPSHLLAPSRAASFDDLEPSADTTCRSGYIVGQGHSC